MLRALRTKLPLIAVVAALVGGAGFAGESLAASGSPAVTAPAAPTAVFHGCVNNTSKALLVTPDRCKAGTTGIFWPGVVGNTSASLVTAATSIKTGGGFFANSTDIGTVSLGAGTWLLTFNAKATPNAATTGEVFPQFFVYDQVKNMSFAGDLFNIGTGPLEPFATNHDSYFSGTAQIVVPAGGETLHVYAFGYDSDIGSGSYALDTATLTATSLATS
jgi:hypothetical protein